MRLIDANTVELDAIFDEPTLSVDGTALDDLDYSTIYITTPVGTIKSPVIQETKATGGGHVDSKFVVNAPANAKTVFSFSMTSTDVKGNEGPHTASVPFTVDRIAPAAPSNFTIA